MAATKVILDTDIGDDIDDALCLALILGCPEAQLRGVTTVFANVAARARQARTILKVAGEKFECIPVAAGCGGAMASRPLHNIKAYLEDHLPNQDGSCLPETELPKADPRHGIDFLLDELKGDVVPVTIGAMTNLAMAIVKDWRVTKRIPKILAMAGEFRMPMSEWNIKCDPEAAHIVFSSGIPMDIIPFTIGIQVTFRQEHLDGLDRSTRPLAQRLAMAIRCWQGNWSDNGKKAKPMPHLFDPMTIATLVRPELCTWKRGWVKVELSGSETYGYTTFREDANGPHRVAWDAKVDECLDLWFERIEKV